jgi:hypothetical protein
MLLEMFVFHTFKDIEPFPFDPGCPLLSFHQLRGVHHRRSIDLRVAPIQVVKPHARC